MRQILTLLVVTIMGLLPFSLHGAAKDKVVDFNYPQDVSKNALADLENALKSGDGRLVVDAIVRYSIAQSGISEENMGDIVSRIESTLQQEKRPEYRALLNYFEACVFREYHLRYGVWDRENPDEDVEADDISTWDDASFGKKINELQCAALSQPEELKRHPITEFEGIIRYDEQGALLVPTLYQFLCLQCGNDSVVGNLWRQSVVDNIPAYIYACLRTGGNAEKLYKQFKDNEHCGLALRETYVDEDLYAAYKDYVARFPESIYTRSIENKIAELDPERC